MTVTVVSRWKVTDTARSTQDARKAKALWLKYGAQDCRLSVVFTGLYAGQMIFASVFLDMAAYAKALASLEADAEWKAFQDDLRKLIAEHGGSLEEREILIGVDL